MNPTVRATEILAATIANDERQAQALVRLFAPECNWPDEPEDDQLHDDGEPRHG